METTFLTIDEQIEHCKSKGISFKIMNERDAALYLRNHTTYYKLRSYRKNYRKNSVGQYIHLDFGHLVDLSLIDVELWRLLLDMTLHIEHAFKVELINAIQAHDADSPHSIVRAFLEAYPDIIDKLDGQTHTAYNINLFNKFESIVHMPVWALLELLSFGQLIMLGRFMAKKLKDKNVERLAIQMHDIKDIRNACAHDNCILNDLQGNNRKYKPNFFVSNELGNLNISKRSRDNKLSNIRTYQMTAVLVFYKRMVKNPYVRESVRLRLQQFKLRLMHNRNYDNNITLFSFFDYFIKLLDSLF